MSGPRKPQFIEIEESSIPAKDLEISFEELAKQLVQKLEENKQEQRNTEEETS